MDTQQNIDTVLFDLDGTLVDHFTTIYRCYCHALEQMGLPPVSYGKVRSTVGGSVPVTLARLIGEARVDEALNHFQAHFDDIMLEDLVVLPGALWLLRELRGRGLRLAVFTNKNGAPARAICDHLGFSPYLENVFGCGDTAFRKPQPEFTTHVMRALAADAATTVMVGDSPFDVAAGHAGRIPVYCVTTGSHSAAELQAHEPQADGVYPDLHALAAGLFNCTVPVASA